MYEYATITRTYLLARRCTCIAIHVVCVCTPALLSTGTMVRTRVRTRVVHVLYVHVYESCVGGGCSSSSGSYMRHDDIAKLLTDASVGSAAARVTRGDGGAGGATGAGGGAGWSEGRT